MRQGDGENMRSLPASRSFASSALFARTFDEGMALVEETARYLDGPGRAEARALSRKGALLYAGESCIAAPDGAIIAQCGMGEDLVIGTLDADAYAAFRHGHEYKTDRRPALYRL